MADGAHGLGGAHRVDTDPVMQGRACLASGRPWTVHLFGSVNSSEIGAPATYAEFTQLRGLQHNPCRSRTGVFRVAIGGREVQRTGNLTPLAPGDFYRGAPPNTAPIAGSSMSARSQIKVGIGIDDGTTQRILFYDTGQTIEVIADCIFVEYLAPSGFYNVDTIAPGTAPARFGLVIDAFVSVAIWELEAPVGEFRGHFTRDVFVAADTQVTIQVPDGAKAVRIEQSAIGAAAVNWTAWYGDPAVVAGATQHAVLSFEPALRRTPLLEIGDSTHIRSDLDADTDRFFHVVWQIEP